jgi:hypothetical protein
MIAEQPTNIGDIVLQAKDGSVVVATSQSQVNSQGLVTGELATAQVMSLSNIGTNCALSFTLNNISGAGAYSLYLDVIQFPPNKVFQSSVTVPFTGDINNTISLPVPVLGLCQIAGRVELVATQPSIIGDLTLQVKDGATPLANFVSQVNIQGLTENELATGQVLCVATVATNATLTFSLGNITGAGSYQIFLDVIQLS